MKDVTAAGATPVKFDDYFTRWEELMEDHRRHPMNQGGPKKPSSNWGDKENSYK